MADVLKAWEGLGYYTRARNLHEAARKMARDHQGAVPSDYAELLRLETELDTVLASRLPEIERLLEDAGTPRVIVEPAENAADSGE